MTTDELIQQLIDVTQDNVNLSRESLEINKQILDLNKLQKLRWERNNPREQDIPVYDWASVTLAPGFSVTFSLEIPEGYKLFLRNLSINFEDFTTYKMYLDEEEQPTTDEVVCDFGDHWQVFTPPKVLTNTAKMVVTNNSTSTKNYIVFYGGFYRAEED
jgi:hypothetical protein